MYFCVIGTREKRMLHPHNPQWEVNKYLQQNNKKVMIYMLLRDMEVNVSGEMKIGSGVVSIGNLESQSVL